ncbi:MAG: ubiquinone biosynthesis protein [Rhodanobacteraceae bacterium]|nr:ubiquinone biosynthesis protein [Rhodanobacteraceae bacterium]
MNSFLDLLTHFPGLVPSVLMGALLVFWLLAIAGVLDFDSFGPHFDTDVDLPEHGGGEHSEAPETLMALGLDKLPFSIVISGIVFFWWLLTLLAVALAWKWIPLPAWIAGSLILVAALVVAVPLAAKALRPLKPLFVVHVSAKQESVLGKACKILTLSVDEKFGQAEVTVGSGAPLNVRVWAETPNTLTKGSSALIIDLDPKSGRYRVEAYEAS